jgi:hypothetical protein
MLFETHESHKTNWPFEFDKDVDIAIGVLRPMHNRAEDPDLDNTEFGPQLLPALINDLDYVA